jgi:hypothetical protein
LLEAHAAECHAEIARREAMRRDETRPNLAEAADA